MSEQNPTLSAGKYQHYKGMHYQVFGLVRHSETEEWLVHYQALYGDFGHWVRPLAMFTEMVEIEGQQQPRFKLIEPNP
ncbi:MAG: DUF1653 domain-containing protein [Oceanobacter sp.]